MESLRTRLFVVLVAATGIVWLAAVVWIYTDSRAQIDSILNRRLMEAARMVATLVEDQGSPALNAAKPDAAKPAERVVRALTTGRYERHLSCQIWSFDGQLIGASDGAPATRLSNQTDGLSQREIDGERWQVFALNDPEKHVRILVGDNLNQRNQLERSIIGGVLMTAAIILPVLALLIWFSVTRGLRPLRQATHDLAGRDADNLEPIDLRKAPSEIRPLVDALNRLFAKVAAARDHERSFLAYAAHELRTPLAGLKTQVQVALAAREADVRNNALGQTLLAVDRTSRLVQQLLTMSHLDAGRAPTSVSWFLVKDRLQDLLDTTDPKLRPQRVSFQPGMERLRLQMEESLFDLSMRNLMENALQMTPEAGPVRWTFRLSETAPVLSLDDDGPGIEAAERDLVTQKFFRGKHKSASGSGLGLAIVSAALEQAGARLKLGSASELKGLRVDILLKPGSLGLDAEPVTDPRARDPSPARQETEISRRLCERSEAT